MPLLAGVLHHQRGGRQFAPRRTGGTGPRVDLADAHGVQGLQCAQRVADTKIFRLAEHAFLQKQISDGGNIRQRPRQRERFAAARDHNQRQRKNTRQQRVTGGGTDRVMRDIAHRGAQLRIGGSRRCRAQGLVDYRVLPAGTTRGDRLVQRLARQLKPRMATIAIMTWIGQNDAGI